MKNILLVHAKGGAPLEHAFPRIADCARLHVLAVTALPSAAAPKWRAHCTSIVDDSEQQLSGEALVTAIVQRARQVAADAVMCLSEFAVVAVAEASARLGLAGPGPNVRRSRDKRLMRETWQRAGVPIPGFARVDDVEQLRAAFDDLTAPLLLKAAWSAGSIGQVVLQGRAEAGGAWTAMRHALAEGADHGYRELYEPQGVLVEEIVDGAAGAWYGADRYADYLSVEGIVADGTYHPLCITSRMPTVPPFTELSNNAPCVLPEHLQRRIEAVARQAVDALGLRTCGTHTEIKLADGGEMFVIESAARFGGCMVTKEVEAVFGLDPIAMLCRELLGEPQDYPDAMLVEGRGAAASLALIPMSARGVPWTTTPIWDSTAVDWRTMLSAGSTIEVVAGLTVPDGTRMPEYNPAAGAGNWAGIFFLTARDPAALLRDCTRVLDGLEAALNGVGVDAVAS